MGVIGAANGVLFDIDGTLVEGDRGVPGAAELLQSLDSRGLPYRLVTNTTRRPVSTIAAALHDVGIAVDVDRILAPAILARRRIVESGAARAIVLAPDATLEDLEGVELVDDDPNWIVVGDLGERFTWALLDRTFRQLADGARLLALHKNRYWHDGNRLRIDAGPFVAALEYAAGVEAEVVGKPSPAFFELALSEMGVAAPGAVMVGDDVRTDCGGARRVGCRTVLVRTGKFRPSDLEVDPPPDHVVDSVAELLEP